MTYYTFAMSCEFLKALKVQIMNENLTNMFIKQKNNKKITEIEELNIFIF